MNALRCSAVVVCFFASVHLAVAADDELDAQVKQIEAILEKWPGWYGDDYRRAVEATARILSMPRAAEAYLEPLFDPKTDPYFMPPDKAALTPEQRKLLKAVRNRAFYITVMLSQRYGRWLANAALRKVPAAKRPAAARFLDRLCSDIRPKVLRRALAVGTDERYVLCAQHVVDLRILDAVEAYCKRNNIPIHSYPVRLLVHAAGKRDLMRQVFTKHDRYKPFKYLLRCGDAELLTKTFLDQLKMEKDPSRRGDCLQSIAGIDCPAARKACLGFLEQERARLKANREHQLFNIFFPDFFDPARAAWYIRLYLDQPELRRDRRSLIFALFEWLRQHRRREGIELARKVLADGGKYMSFYHRFATSYLLALRDKHTVARVRADLKSKDAKTVDTAIWHLIRAGLWSGLPDLLQKKLTEDKLRAVHAGRVLDAAEERLSPEAHGYVRLAAQIEEHKPRGYALLVRMGDPQATAHLKKLLPDLWVVQRVPAMAALYEAGEADQFDGLVAAMQTEGFPPEFRADAARALGAGPKALRTRAARALADQLLSPYGAVSEGAHAALCKLSGRKDVPFSPWATDDVRTKQAQVWQAWVRDLR